jgi:hypothetical protein
MHFKTYRKGGPNARIIFGRLRANHGLLGNYPRGVKSCIKRAAKKVATHLHILQVITPAFFIRSCLSEAQ